MSAIDWRHYPHDAQDAEEARAMADEKPQPFHRCHYTMMDHCPRCTYLDDDPPEVCPKCRGDDADCWMCDGKGMIH